MLSALCRALSSLAGLGTYVSSISSLHFAGCLCSRLCTALTAVARLALVSLIHNTEYNSNLFFISENLGLLGCRIRILLMCTYTDANVN